ncbi:hypothetical protein [Streptomyces sp. NPDC057412]|uniref:hypothetical protein n=1 Tax=Streptomyces sp. NPDC057412 TaxID=3346123 RepID=UPI0036C1D199
MDEKGIPAVVDDLVIEAEVLTLAAEAEAGGAESHGERTDDANEAHAPEVEGEAGNDDRLVPAHRKELFHDLFDQVRLETFLAYPDPRSDFSAITIEAFVLAFLKLPAEAGDNEVYEKVMDIATQLAEDDKAYFAKRRGFAAVHIPSLVDLFGFQAGEEFHAWLTVVDGMEMPDRAVYHLRDVYGWPNAKVADVLGISEGWASKLYSRAEIHLTSAGVSVEELKQCFFNVEIKRR